MSTTTEQPTDLTQRIQARDGVAVVVYTKNQCFGCTKTKTKLDEAGIHYTTVNVEEDASAFHYVTEVLATGKCQSLSPPPSRVTSSGPAFNQR